MGRYCLEIPLVEGVETKGGRRRNEKNRKEERERRGRGTEKDRRWKKGGKEEEEERRIYKSIPLFHFLAGPRLFAMILSFVVRFLVTNHSKTFFFSEGEIIFISRPN
jgi:hypothetical protein